MYANLKKVFFSLYVQYDRHRPHISFCFCCSFLFGPDRFHGAPAPMSVCQRDVEAQLRPDAHVSLWKCSHGALTFSQSKYRNIKKKKNGYTDESSPGFCLTLLSVQRRSEGGKALLTTLSKTSPLTASSLEWGNIGRLSLRFEFKLILVTDTGRCLSLNYEVQKGLKWTQMCCATVV